MSEDGPSSSDPTENPEAQNAVNQLAAQAAAIERSKQEAVETIGQGATAAKAGSEEILAATPVSDVATVMTGRDINERPASRKWAIASLVATLVGGAVVEKLFDAGKGLIRHGDLIRYGDEVLDAGGGSTALVRRQGRVASEVGSDTSKHERRAAETLAAHGYDVTHLQTASSRGIHGVRTADLSVEGMGHVDVVTPEVLTTTAISRRIEKKAGQAPTILVQADIPARQMHIVANRVWGKPGAQRVQEVIFEHNGQLTRFVRPAEK